MYEAEGISENYNLLPETEVINDNEGDDNVYDNLTQKHNDDYLLVAAIDLGTAASGYCFSFRNEYQTNPLQISTNIWIAATTVLRSSKTPTCILFDPKKEFVAFGYEAQNEYSALVSEQGNWTEWYYFENFKMSLYENKVSYR